LTEEASNRKRVQLSLKFGMNGSGYLIIEGSTVEEMLVEAGRLPDYAKTLNEIVDAVQAEMIVRNTFPETQTVTTTQAPPQSQPSPIGLVGPLCSHNVPRVWREGVSKAGNAYKGWFCDVKGDPRMPQCAAQFVR
jgi:hypothetical protein